MDFPHLPAGCSIQLDQYSRKYILDNIRENLKNLSVQIPERLQSFTNESGKELTFGNFVRRHDYEPEILLAKQSWTEWKARAQLAPIPSDPDLPKLRKTLLRAAFMNGPKEIALTKRVLRKTAEGLIGAAVLAAGDEAIPLYYRIWGDKGSNLNISSLKDSFARLSGNPSILNDLDEILAWAEAESTIRGLAPELPFACSLELHAHYTTPDIQARLGQADLRSAGQRGVGVIHFPALRAYALLATFQKTER